MRWWCRLPVFVLASLHAVLALNTPADWTPLGDDLVDTVRSSFSQEGSRVAQYYQKPTVGRVLEVYEYSSDDGTPTLVGQPFPQLLPPVSNATSLTFQLSGDGNRLLFAPRGEYARMYEYDAQDNQWKPMGQDLVPNDLLPNDKLSPLDLEFSTRYFPSVGISYNGSRIVIGWGPEIVLLDLGMLTFTETFGVGRVWIYEYDDATDRWEQLGETLKDETSPWFGANVKMSGDGSRVAIGQGKAIEDDQEETKMSLTWRVYQSGATLSSWESLGAERLDEYGHIEDVSLSLDGSVLALGTKCSEFPVDSIDGCFGQVGRARVLQYDTGSWIQLGQELIGETRGDGYGHVSLSGDGTRLAVAGDGAAVLDSGTELLFGRVRTFAWDADRTSWVQDGELVGDQAGDRFGERIHLSLDGARLGVESESYTRLYQRIQPLFVCPELTQEPFGVYAIGCDGNNYVQTSGTCPGQLESDSTPCSEYADDPLFSFCHECSGKPVCSSSSDKIAVCNDVAADSCSSLNYEAEFIQCENKPDFLFGYKVCKDGVLSSNFYGSGGTDSCVETFEHQDTTQCNLCPGLFLVCTQEGMTCDRIPIPTTAVSPTTAPAPTIVNPPSSLALAPSVPTTRAPASNLSAPTASNTALSNGRVGAIITVSVVMTLLAV